MNQPLDESGRLPAQDRTLRERELEIEIARLEAELEAATGGDANLATSKFLELAATTVDRAVSDARREADALVSELSAEAERRRDDAVRIAEEAEAEATRFAGLAAESESAAEAARLAAQQVTVTARRELESARDETRRLTDEAHATARSITEAAQAEAEQQAAQIVEAERSRIREELDVVTEVRAALERERAAMDQYNDELRRRVQDLAESMVAFMSSDPDFTDELAVTETPELATTESEAFEPEPAPVPEAFVAEPVPEAFAAEPVPEAFEPEPVPEAAEPEPVAAESEPIAEESAFAEASPFGEPAVGTLLDDPWHDAPPASPFADTAEEVEAEPALDATPEPVFESSPEPAAPFAAPESAFEVAPEPAYEAAPEPAFEAAPEPAFESTSEPAPAVPADLAEAAAVDFPQEAPAERDPADLFGAATPEEREPAPLSSLFSDHGARLVEQTSPDTLAEALASDEPAAEEQFQNFFNGDDELDESRDWLLRPETP